MTSGLPPRILIKKGQFAESAYSGQLELAGLPRLHDVVQEADAEIRVSMQLHWDSQWQRPALQLAMDLRLSLQCQRCMRPMQWLQRVENRLLLAEEDEQLAEPGDMDIARIRAGELDALSLIEDEILLALPLAPLHGSDTACGRTVTDVDAAGSGNGKHPFAALAALKTKH